MHSQQAVFQKVTSNSESMVRAIYAIAKRSASNSKLFSDRDFVKKCIINAGEFVCSKSVKDYEKISLSRVMITRRVEELA